MHINVTQQRAKKVVSDSLGLVDFAIELVNSALNLSDRQVNFFEKLKLQKNCEINFAHQKVFWASPSWSEWQAVKMTFFAPYTSKFHDQPCFGTKELATVNPL